MEELLSNVEPRIYQQVIFSDCVTNPGNTLVVLPTGLGKTVIMAYLTAYYLKKDPDKQILILTPTRPLVHQIKEMMVEFIVNLDPEFVLEISGEVNPSKRESMYSKAKIIVATPQTIENDLLYNRLALSRIRLLCIDEVHRATGDYAYVGIAAQAVCQIIGFTATPGNNPEKILEVCQNLRFSKVSVTDDSDLDVDQFLSIHTPKVVWINLPDEYVNILAALQSFEDELINTIKNRVPRILETKYLGKRETLDIHQKVIQLTKQNPNFGDLLIITSNLIRVQHLKDLVESQGFPQALLSIQKWKKKKLSKALKLFLEDTRTISIENTLIKNTLKHPKLRYLIAEITKALKEDKSEESKIIIFSNFRDTIRFLFSELREAGIESGMFIGHSSSRDDKGLTHKEQLSVVESFKTGNLKILLSTSVGEEGLDVGNCDLVVFYDSVPSVVRAIQRTGRGRKKQSRVIHLVTKKTRDEAMYWAIKRKDRLMKNYLKKDLPKLLEKGNQDTLDKFFHPDKEQFPQNNDSSSIIIIIDARETASRIPKLLKQKEVQIKSQQLEVGDYILSDRLVVELKSYSDFLNSIIDGRLFHSLQPGKESQLIRLSRQPFPLIIIQLEPDFQTQNVHINSVMGAISSIILDFKIPIIFTQNELETATLLFQLAKREQLQSTREFSLPSKVKKESNLEIIQIYMLSSIPGINIRKAKELLSKFGTIQKIALAEIEDLMAVPNIGKKLAKRINMILTSSGNINIP